MGKKYILANWKANKTEAEAMNWLQNLLSNIDNLLFENNEIIICPPFTLLSNLKSYIIDCKLSFKLGAQDISQFEDGSYTGEVTGRMLQGLVDYVIIGHSERRKNFGETDEIVGKKVKIALKYNLIPIICVSELSQTEVLKKFLIDNSNFVILYEPLFAIGSGQADTPEDSNSMAQKIKGILPASLILYGGSVTAENVGTFIVQPLISGVGVGKASLDSGVFLQILENASKV